MGDVFVEAVSVGKRVTWTSVTDDGRLTEWESGILKTMVQGAVWLGETNLDGDGHAALNVHGGPDRSVLVFDSSQYGFWEPTLGALDPGSFGENLTVTGTDETQVCIGDIWTCDEIALQVSQPRIPCFKLSRRLEHPSFHLQLTEHGRGGWYCRTIRQGNVRAGEKMVLAERLNREWTVDRAYSTFFCDDPEEWAALARIDELSELWRTHLSRKLSKQSM